MDKPLHVQVAEALGWTGVTNERSRTWYGYPPAGETGKPGKAIRDGSGRFGIDIYDLDWSATGPLIEKHRLAVNPCMVALTPGFMASALPAYHFEIGETPLIAICKLIVSLKAAGKL